MLEEQGWKVRTELSMAVFIDPEKEAQDIVTLVLDAVDEINGPLEPEVEIPSDALLEETAPETEDGVDLGADDLDEVVARTDEEREHADELHTGMLERLVVEATPEREPRPAIARGPSVGGLRGRPTRRAGPVGAQRRAGTHHGGARRGVAFGAGPDPAGGTVRCGPDQCRATHGAPPVSARRPRRRAVRVSEVNRRLIEKGLPPSWEATSGPVDTDADEDGEGRPLSNDALLRQRPTPRAAQDLRTQRAGRAACDRIEGGGHTRGPRTSTVRGPRACAVSAQA